MKRNIVYSKIFKSDHTSKLLLLLICLFMAAGCGKLSSIFDNKIVFVNGRTMDWGKAVTELKKLNPEWNGKYELLKNNSGKVYGLDLSNKTVREEGKSQFVIKDQSISYDKAELIDISPITGMDIEKLIVRNCPLKNISALRAMKLKYLDLSSTRVTQIDILYGMPLEQLYLDDTKVADITPLKVSPIKNLLLRNTLVSNLQPLVGKKLMFLDITNTPAAKTGSPKFLDVEYLINK